MREKIKNEIERPSCSRETKKGTKVKEYNIKARQIKNRSKVRKKYLINEENVAVEVLSGLHHPPPRLILFQEEK